MFVIIIVNEDIDYHHVLGTWDTRREAEQALQREKDVMKKRDVGLGRVTKMFVTGIWKIN